MNTYTTKSMRGANMVDAQPQRLESADGRRWATGRNVKRAEANHRFTIVQVWTLKCRDQSGRAITMATHRDVSEAREWCQLAPASGN